MSELRILKEVLNRENTGVLLESFDRRRSKLTVRIRKARHDPSESSIHKVRVACRRFLAILEALEIYVSRKETGPARDIVRGFLKRLGEMRDVHVHLIATGELLKDFPQLSGFVDDLAGREEKLKRAAALTMRNFRDRTLGKQTDRVVEGFVDRAARERDEATHARIARKVNKAHERVLRHRAGIDTEWPRSIHRMRVAFKKFRYTAEIAAPLFDQLTVERLDAMQAFQTRMGHIQDLETLLGAMMTFRERYGQTSLLVPENEIRRKQRARVREFMSAADEARFFWGTAETSLDLTPGRAGGEAG